MAKINNMNKKPGNHSFQSEVTSESVTVTQTMIPDVIGSLYLSAKFTKQPLPYLYYSDLGAMLSAKTYKNEEEMNSVLTPGGQGRQGCTNSTGRAQPEGIPLDVYVSGASGLGLRAPKISRL